MKLRLGAEFSIMTASVFRSVGWKGWGNSISAGMIAGILNDCVDLMELLPEHFPRMRDVPAGLSKVWESVRITSSKS